ncbi:MAG: hypothetical protein SOY30_15220 [Eubacteriales bacterium]|nr:hypothetical protein [Eubacteriales bacterium]
MLDAILSFACDLERGVERTLIRPALLTGDSQAHTFRLTVKRGGGDAAIAGASVAAYFVRADGVTVPITGSVEGSVALVTLPDGCYRVPGRFQLVVKLALDGAVSAVFWGDGAVAASDTDAILDEDGVIPSLDEVLAQVAAAEAAAASANSAAASATGAASSAQTAAARADAAALSIESLGADADTLAPGSAATASWTTVDGAKVLHIGVPQGIQGPQGPKGEPGKDGSGSVSSVNGVASVGGNVTLTAADVGALPDTYTPPVTSVDGKTGDVNVDMLGAYPVGSIYLSASETSPASLFGGTWERIEDRFLLAAGSTYGAGSTGGEAEHTLTVDELPNINGTINMHGAGTGGAAVSAVTGVFSPGATEAGYNTGENKTGAPSVSNVVFNVGGGQPHNNMPPYLAVYMWKRVA